MTVVAPFSEAARKMSDAFPYPFGPTATCPVLFRGFFGSARDGTNFSRIARTGLCQLSGSHGTDAHATPATTATATSPMIVFFTPSKIAVAAPLTPLAFVLRHFVTRRARKAVNIVNAISQGRGIDAPKDCSEDPSPTLNKALKYKTFVCLY